MWSTTGPYVSRTMRTCSSVLTASTTTPLSATSPCRKRSSSSRTQAPPVSRSSLSPSHCKFLRPNTPFSVEAPRDQVPCYQDLHPEVVFQGPAQGRFSGCHRTGQKYDPHGHWKAQPRRPGLRFSRSKFSMMWPTIPAFSEPSQNGNASHCSTNDQARLTDPAHGHPARQ